MPEATIDKNGQALLKKDEIGFIQHRMVPPPTVDALGT